MYRPRLMRPEVHDVVVWPQAMTVLDHVVADLAARFSVLDVCRLGWSPQRWDENLVRFYGYDVRARDKRARWTPAAPVLVVVRDPAPVYGVRTRSGSPGLVNTGLHEAKLRYRALAGGGFGVHSSVDPPEADRDLFLLLGVRSTDLRSSPAWADTRPRVVEGDVLGAHGWTAAGAMFTALALTTQVVVLEQDRDPRGRDRWTVLARDAGQARLTAGGLHPVVAGQQCALQLHELGDGTQPNEWQALLLAGAAVGEDGVPRAAPLDAFHARLLRVLGGPAGADELAQLAAEVGAPLGDYRDRDFATAVHNEFLRERGWYRRPERRRSGVVGAVAARGRAVLRR